MPDLFWTPHSGYHWDRTKRRFFEGWYFRLTLPESGESFAFMYSIDDPAGQSALSSGAAQILGPGKQYLYRVFPAVNQFWAWSHRLGLGHWGTAVEPLARYLSPDRFFERVHQGYQATATRHQGCVQDAATGAIARWDYAVEPVYGWGAPASPPLPTAGWLSYLPIFEPGWQVLMAHGLATGWAEWQDQRYEFAQAPTYAEKNWGGAFPERWFWVQCNGFTQEPDLTITAVGGRRQALSQSETVGLIGLHFQGQFIALISLNADMTWQVEPWGTWHVSAQDHRYRIILQGKTDEKPVPVRVPTFNGLKFECWDTTQGHLQIQVWQRSPSRPETLVLEATSNLAGLEVGGSGWHQPWQFP
ncbi:MAG: tocopherol cyclase family protein [Leptolyngbya sp. SIO1E4]|nr:tocopherol cyclase family protein [Leptolyngbya sp. SIO1E4]